MQPIEYVWRWLKSGYEAQRANSGGAPGFLEGFFEGVSEEALVKTVDRCDAAARRLAEPEEALLAHDDLDGGLDGGLGGEGEAAARGEGELWG